MPHERTPPYASPPNRRLDRLLFPIFWGALALVFFGGMALMAWRDYQAVERCHRLGGQTYDSGSHCTVGGRTVSTR